MKITEKDIWDVIKSMSQSSDEKLFQKTESELDEYWLFEWNNSESVEWNTYTFHYMLKLYGAFCLRWEDKHNGSCCVVERVRDKYLMPKIKQFVDQMTLTAVAEYKKVKICGTCLFWHENTDNFGECESDDFHSEIRTPEDLDTAKWFGCVYHRKKK